MPYPSRDCAAGWRFLRCGVALPGLLLVAPNKGLVMTVIRSLGLHAFSILLAVGLAPIAPSGAQAPTTRRFADSLITELTAASIIANLPPESRCRGQSADMERLCAGLLQERRSELTNSKDDARQAEAELERLVTDFPRSPLAWYGLARIRLQLAHDSMLSQDGAQMLLGTSFLTGAANALSEALRLDPTLGAAGDALATLPEPRSRSALRDRVTLLRRARDVLSSVTLAAMAGLERDAGNVDSAIALERHALAAGQADSGLVSLGLARDLYRIGQPDEGRVILLRGAATATPVAQRAYRQELAWVASPQELLAWDSVLADERSAWVAIFWQKRDIAEGRNDGARLIEHYKRLEYAVEHYRITVPQTGRQRMHTVTPSEEYHAEYEMERFAARYPECFPTLATLLIDAATIGHDTPFDYYRPVQDLVDDRGVIWIRHGPPTAVAQTHNGEAVEVWRYDRAAGPLILQFRESDFQGSTGASTLVPTVLSMSPAIRNQVCFVDVALCSTSTPRTTPLPEPPMRFSTSVRTCGLTFTGHEAGVAFGVAGRESEVREEGARVGGGVILRARDEGRAAIDLATTTDSYQREFRKAIHPAVQVYGLDRAIGGSPRLVIAFALPGNELAHTESGSTDTRVIYPVSIQIMAANTRDGTRTDIDTLRQFATLVPLAAGQFITGLIEVPIRAGRYSVGVAFTQTDGHGAIANLEQVEVPGHKPQLSISDLVLGRMNSGLQWNSGTTQVSLNPLNTFPVGTVAEAYYQLSGLTPGTSVVTAFAFFRVAEPPKNLPDLTISYAQVANLDRIEISRSLDLANLRPGQYRMRVTVLAAGVQASRTTWLTIVK